MKQKHNRTSQLEPHQQNALSILERPGQALDAETRGALEPRFGHSFGDIRVHSGGEAISAARNLEARAFAVGQDVVLGDVNLDTPLGQEILVHELAHTVQQRGVSSRNPSSFAPPGLSAPDSTVEHEARAATRGILSGQSVSMTQTDAVQISCWGDSETNLAISLGLTAGGMLLPGMGGVLASAAGGADAVRQGPAANDPMATMKNWEMGLGFGNAVVGAAAGLGGASMLGAGGMASMGAGAALTGGGLTGVAALGPASAVLGAGLAGAGVGHYLSENTSVGGHTVDSLGGVDALMTNPGERSWMLRTSESMSDNWDQGNYLSSAGNGLQLAGAGTVGALAGLGGGIVDAASWAGNGIASGASALWDEL
jgi:Domain of unknown function (DUF4157)